jgi:hypothetical protein
MIPPFSLFDSNSGFDKDSFVFSQRCQGLRSDPFHRYASLRQKTCGIDIQRCGDVSQSVQKKPLPPFFYVADGGPRQPDSRSESFLGKVFPPLRTDLFSNLFVKGAAVFHGSPGGKYSSSLRIVNIADGV